MADETPDYVNDVPGRHCTDTPAPRCGHVYGHDGFHRGVPVKGKRCGYPVTHGVGPYCIFHRVQTPDDAPVREELELAQREEAYLAELRICKRDLSGLQLPAPSIPNSAFNGVSLKGADLRGGDLTGCAFGVFYWHDEHICDLGEAQLQSSDLSRSSLVRAHLTDAYMVSTKLSDTDLTRAVMRRCNLQGATIEGRSVLRNADLTDALLRDCRIGREVDLEGVVWRQDERPWWVRIAGEQEPVFRDERELRNWPPRYGKPREEWFRTISGCERTYRQIKRCYQDSGQYEQAGQFFIREMECKRKQSTGLRRAAFWLMRVLSDYFESPGKVVGIALGMVLVFAYLHGCLGLCECAGPHVSVAPQWPGAVSWEGIEYFVTTCVYFSMVTFTTLGHGDIHSANGWGRMACSVEAATGAIMLALFLVCLARKYGRA